MSNKKKYSVPVTWQVYDTIEIVADSFEEAVSYAKENTDNIPLGKNPQYIDGSWNIADSEIHEHFDSGSELSEEEMCFDVEGAWLADTSDKVVTIHCGEKRVWKHRDEALAFFREAMKNTEGSERKRIINIVLRLTREDKICDDSFV